LRYKIGFKGIVCILLGISCLHAQVMARPEKPAATSRNLTLNQLVSAARYYFRDSTELPMLQIATISMINASGKASKPRTQSIDYLFHGYSKKQSGGNATMHTRQSMWATFRGSKTLKASFNSDILTMMPGILLYSDTSDLTFETKRTAGDPAFTARFLPKKDCSGFVMKENKDFYFPDHYCGEYRFVLNDDLRFEKYSLDVTGLPAEIDLAPFGKCTLTRYHGEVEFQSVALAGDKDPFLVPRLATATLETSKGTVVISSRYEPKPR
jgi:hypothetical protein